MRQAPKGKVNIAADDADVGVTFEFNKGALTVKNGLAPDFKLQIAGLLTHTFMLMRLSKVMSVA